MSKENTDVKEKVMNIVDVFTVYGDFGNVGCGELIGIFDDIEKAEKVAKGRGSLDCGGDGDVRIRKAIKDGDDFYLIKPDFPLSINVKRSSREEYI